MLKFLSVNFNGIDSSPFRLSYFRLIQARYQHEIAYLTFNEWNASFDSVKPGIPVDVLIKDQNNTKKFYGYVHHIEPKKSPGSDNITVVVIGASYVFKQAKQEVYKNVTASDVAIKLAKEHNFSYGVTPHPRVFPQISQSGQSDWQLLVRLARQCGYSLRAENTELYFQPLTEDFTTFRYEAQTFYMNDANNPEGSTIYSFKPIVGETLSFDEGAKSATAVSGIDIFNNESVFKVAKQKKEVSLRKQRQDDFFDRFQSSTVAPDYVSAVYEAEAADVLTMFPYRAEVEVLGNTALKPDMPIYLDGVGPDYTGYWIILEAEHLIENLIYTTKLTVGLDSLGIANTWKDGRSLTIPPSPEKRTIIPGQVQSNTKVETALKVLRQGKLTSSGYSINTTRNRSVSASDDKTVVNWVGIGKKDLKSTVQKESLPAVVYEKLISENVI